MLDDIHRHVIGVYRVCRKDTASIATESLCLTRSHGIRSATSSPRFPFASKSASDDIGLAASHHVPRWNTSSSSFLVRLDAFGTFSLGMSETLQRSTVEASMPTDIRMSASTLVSVRGSNSAWRYNLSSLESHIPDIDCGRNRSGKRDTSSRPPRHRV